MFRLLVIIFLLAACSSRDFKPHVEIDTQAIPAGIIGKEYFAEIKASVHNFVNDDNYPIRVIFKSGSLPEGIKIESKDNYGEISGIPLETGEFHFSVQAYSKKLYEDNLAFDTEENASFLASDIESFTLKVTEK